MTTAAPSGLQPVRKVLDNGLVVIVKESRTTPAVTIQASVQAGSALDPEPQLGLAFFLSRVIDRGTERRSADQIAEELDGRGVSLNIGVSRHLTTLSCTCLSDDFMPVFDLMADVLRRPSLPEAEIATRRAQIITAIRQDDDSPAVVASEELMALLYQGGHPYGRRAKGTLETVEAIDRLSLTRLHADRFGPASVSLVIVGDVDPSGATDAASRLCGDWQRVAATPWTLPPVIAPVGRRQRVLPMMNKAQADIAYGFTAIGRSDPDYYACWTMNHVLGQYAMGGRLGDSIRERQGMAYYIFSTLDANVAAGPLVIRAGVNPANVERAVASIDAEIARAAREGMTAQEVAESKQYLVGSLPRNLETNAAMAAFLQSAEFFSLGLDYDVRLPGLIQRVTHDDVCAAARRLLDVDRATVVVAGPYEGPAIETDGGSRSAAGRS